MNMIFRANLDFCLTVCNLGANFHSNYHAAIQILINSNKMDDRVDGKPKN